MLRAWWSSPGRLGPRSRRSARLAAAGYDPELHVALIVFGRAILVVLMALLLAGLGLLAGNAFAQTIPRDAQRYQLTLKREAQRVWGLAPPVATFAAQIHQESRWRADARSPVGALGLTQFMPATADWIGGMSPDLAERAPMNPTWSIRALVVYDLWLFQRVQADNNCERMAFTLAAYNGGLGWVNKRKRLSAEPGICLDATCAINPGITAANQRENEHYPQRILRTLEPLYATWGEGSCS